MGGVVFTQTECEIIELRRSARMVGDEPKQFTQEDIAEKRGVSQAAISKTEARIIRKLVEATMTYLERFDKWCSELTCIMPGALYRDGETVWGVEDILAVWGAMLAEDPEGVWQRLILREIYATRQEREARQHPFWYFVGSPEVGFVARPHRHKSPVAHNHDASAECGWQRFHAVDETAKYSGWYLDTRPLRDVLSKHGMLKQGVTLSRDC